MISVIIPAFNESATIEKTLKSLLKQKGNFEVIVVDGGSKDNTKKLARKHSKVITAGKNRAEQMNAGAKKAKCEILLFLHADSTLPKNALSKIEEIKNTEQVGGGFHMRFDSKKLVFRLIEFRSNNLRVNFTKTFFGDQGIFLKKKTFQQLKGFPNVPFLEDLLFSTKMKRKGKVKIIKAPVTTSPRRYLENGILKTTFLYFTILLLYHLGMPVKRIHQIYKKSR